MLYCGKPPKEKYKKTGENINHVKTSSCGTIERIERMFFFLGFAQSFNNQVNLLGGEYS